MIAVLLAKTSNALALIATSVCKKPLPQCPASKEISWLRRIGSFAVSGCNSVENIVSKGLVIPIVSTTSKSAIPATFLRGVRITGDNWEMLSKPEKARKEPAKPINNSLGPSAFDANVSEKSLRKVAKERCVKTVKRMAISLPNAMIAPMKLTFALSLIPNQLRRPRSTRKPIVRKSNGSWIGPKNGIAILIPIAGSTTLKYCIPDRQLIAAVRK